VGFLFLVGGPSQYETFDPKPGGTESHTSINDHIATALPGVRFSAVLGVPAEARQTSRPAHRGAVVQH